MKSPAINAARQEALLSLRPLIDRCREIMRMRNETEPHGAGDVPLADDLLTGAAAIAAELGLDRRLGPLAARNKIYGMLRNGKTGWPIWKDGGTLYARRSTLRRYADEREREAMGDR